MKLLWRLKDKYEKNFHGNEVRDFLDFVEKEMKSPNPVSNERNLCLKR